MKYAEFSFKNIETLTESEREETFMKIGSVDSHSSLIDVHDN